MRYLAIFILCFFAVSVNAKQVEFPMGSGIQVEINNRGDIIGGKWWVLPSGFKFWTIEKAVADELSPLEEIKMYAMQMSSKYKISWDMFNKVIICESQWNAEAKGDYRNGKPMAYGLLQFWFKTFEAFKKEADMPELEYKDPQDQLTLGAWGFANDKESHWTCYKKAVLN